MRKGQKMSEEQKEKIRQAKLLSGILPPSRKGIKHSEETKQKMSELHNGEKNPHWKGGISKDLEHIK